MADSLKSRVGRLIAGSAHAWVERLESLAPQAMMDQSIREVGAVVDEVRHELGRVSANRHLAQQQHARLNAQHAELSEQSRQALIAGREDLARAAVARQLDIEAQIPVLEATLAEHARNEEELKGYVGALLAKQREMADAVAEFVRGRAGPGPNAQAGLPPAAGVQHRLASATESFDRLYQRQTGLSPQALGASLEQSARLQDLEALVRQNQIDERLSQLRGTEA